MLINEVKYYLMTTKQLGKEIIRLRTKLESETNVKKRIKYINALADIIKTLIRKNRDNEVFMKYVTNELNKLRSQIKQVL